jgi:hypothetical protein
MGDIEQLNKITSIPFFLSIADFKNEMQSKYFMRAKVEAQVFDYAKYCPPFACIYVTCKKCQYINFAPFHFIGSKKPNILKNMTEDYETEIGETQPCFSTDDQNQLKRQESSKNFSLRWLNTAEPGSITQNGIFMLILLKVGNISLFNLLLYRRFRCTSNELYMPSLCIKLFRCRYIYRYSRKFYGYRNSPS